MFDRPSCNEGAICFDLKNINFILLLTRSTFSRSHQMELDGFMISTGLCDVASLVPRRFLLIELQNESPHLEHRSWDTDRSRIRVNPLILWQCTKTRAEVGMRGIDYYSPLFSLVRVRETLFLTLTSSSLLSFT